MYKIFCTRYCRVIDIFGVTADSTFIQIMGQELLDVYRLLKSVESTERDELTRAHAQAALGELDVIMKNLLFPNGSKELIKKISVLDVNAM